MASARGRSEALLRQAWAQIEGALTRTPPRRPSDRRDRGSVGEPAPVEPPRNPTLSGGAAAELDA